MGIEIQLTKGMVAIVGNLDSDLRYSAWRYYKKKHERQGYAIRSDGKRGYFAMHKIIARRMGITGMVDHKNRNSLDNRRSNLRPCTPNQNRANSEKTYSNTSGYKGVTWDKEACESNPWRARICKDRIVINIGRFATAKEAALAYDREAHKLFGEFANPNF